MNKFSFLLYDSNNLRFNDCAIILMKLTQVEVIGRSFYLLLSYLFSLAFGY